MPLKQGKRRTRSIMTTCGLLRRGWIVTCAVFLMLTTVDAEITSDQQKQSPHLPNLSKPDGRIFLNNLNSTLIPLGGGGALLVSAIGVIVVVVGAVLLFSLIFNPHALKSGQGLFGPWFGGGFGGYQGAGYQQGGGQYYASQQTQPYLYEPYSKLGYQTPQTR